MRYIQIIKNILPFDCYYHCFHQLNYNNNNKLINNNKLNNNHEFILFRNDFAYKMIYLKNEKNQTKLKFEKYENKHRLIIIPLVLFYIIIIYLFLEDLIMKKVNVQTKFIH